MYIARASLALMRVLLPDTFSDAHALLKMCMGRVTWMSAEIIERVHCAAGIKLTSACVMKVLSGMLLY